MLVEPVDWFCVTEVESGAGMPFFAGATLPTKNGQVVQRDRGPSVADARSLVAFGAEQQDFYKLFGLFVPTIMRDANQFTIVAPCVGKRVIGRRLISVEPESRGFANEVSADKRFRTLSVGGALNRVCHRRDNRGEGGEFCQRWLERCGGTGRAGL